MKMRVAFISRNTLYSGRGGDTVQIIKTAKYLTRMGVEVDIFLSSDIIDYSQYDIIHGFNLIRPADLLKHFNNFDKIKVLSTIYVDYSEFETKARVGVIAKLFKFIGKDTTEYLKTIMRFLKNGERSFNFKYLISGHKRSVIELICQSDMLLPNSRSEYFRINKDYGVSKNYEIIPNAIDVDVFRKDFDVSKKQKNLVICIAKIDGRKNQLHLIRALNNTEFELIIIGKSAPNHLSYYNQCKAEAGKNVSFITEIEQEDLIQYYLRAKVHAMPSWFETTGLSSLEAIALGCNIVITSKGDTEDYFEDKGFYCEPDDIKSIYNAVKSASQASVDLDFRDKVYSEYIWEITAEKTFKAYEHLLSSKY